MSFESFILSINALSSLIWPVDPIVPVAWPGVTDVAAGDLARPTVGAYSDPFGMQVIRVYRLAETGILAASGLYVQEGIGVITEAQGVDFFAELDAQAVAQGFADFAAMYAFNITPAGPAMTLIQGIIALTVTPLTPAVPTPAALYALYVISWRAIAIPFWENSPENRIRANLIGFGPDAPAIYSDPANGVANPNARTIGQGGVATTMTAWDYRAYPWPVRQALNALHVSALLDWQAVGSEADYATLRAAYANTTAIALGA
jgi:hypothetical protein